MTARKTIHLRELYSTTLLLFGILPGITFGQNVINQREAKPTAISQQKVRISPSKKEVLTILKTKCNSCHRSKNPFMVFNERNMVKRSSKIEKQVFILKRMPKEGGLPLTVNDSAVLKAWIESLKEQTSKS
ncbi:hypothetical protein [Ekhidna sp. To15]|uniref:hypothetical protein n=1 Tax=Ekhidna sp. To15 TaxID=3395267 RepID=UPI003F520BEB